MVAAAVLVVVVVVVVERKAPRGNARSQDRMGLTIGRLMYA
jgi:hypothetical protein